MPAPRPTGRHRLLGGLVALTALLFADHTAAAQTDAGAPPAEGLVVRPSPGAARDVAALRSETALPVSTISDMVVDDRRGRIYLAGDDAVLVTDLSGHVLQRLEGHPGPARLVLGAEELYVQQADGIASIVLDPTATVGQKLRTATDLHGLALVNGELWTLAGDCSATVVLTKVLPVTGTTTSYPSVAFSNCPIFVGSDARLVVAETGPSSTLHYVYLAQDPPAVTGTGAGAVPNPRRITLDPTGATFTLAWDSLEPATTYRTANFAREQQYPGQPASVAVSTNQGGGLVAVGGYGTTNLALYRTSGAQLWTTMIGQPPPAFSVVDRCCLAFSGDGRRIYGVVTTGGSAHALFAIDASPVLDRSGEFHPLDPARVFDSRATGPVTQVNVPMTGRGGVPGADVSAVAINVTVTDPTGPGYLSVYPQGTARPNASTVNYVAGQTVPNMAIVGLGATGQLAVYASTSTHVIIDVVGWFGTDAAPVGALFHPVLPFRWFDTRVDPRGDGRVRPVGPAQRVFASATGGQTSATAHLTAVALNVTVADTTSDSYLTVAPFDAPPGSSNLNWRAGDIVPNAVLAKVNPTNGRVQFTNAFGDTDVITDSTGYWDDGTLATGVRFHPVQPQRLVDTRTGHLAPGSTMGTAHRLDPGGSVRFSSQAALGPGATTVVLNVTAIDPAGSGYLSVFPYAQPLGDALQTSLVNFTPGMVRPNMTIMPLGAGGEIEVFNASAGTIDIVVDITGYFA